MTPSCSLVDAIMTRTSRARIRPFTRICGCRLDQFPQRRNGSAPRRRVTFIAIKASAFANARALFLRHGCDSPQRSARIKVRKPKRSCKQQFRTGKVKLVTIRCRCPGNHFAFAQRGASKREPDTIISETKILCRFGHAIRCEPLRKTWIVPVSIEHERRTHHHPTASIEPLLLFA